MIDGMTPSGQGLAGSFGLAGAGGAADVNPGLALDCDAYLPMLADYDITEAQARELIATLWQIMLACVELGIKIDVCGELGLDAVPVLSSRTASLDSDDQTI